MMRGLEGRVALVTGAGGAIGRAISRRLAEERAIVGVLDKNGDAAEETVRIIAASGGRASAITADITSHRAVSEGVAGFERAIGPTELLVNNAGWDRVGTFLDSTPDFWEKVIAINLTGPLNVHHAVLRGMAERKRGRVVNIASDAGRVGSSGEAVYSACKGGIIAFTKTMARELAGTGITLNAVCPGPTEKPLFESFLGEGEAGKRIYEGLKRAIPMKRIGQPEDIPGLVAFLLSEEAAFITGQVISVSGGLTMSG
jgi:2-hydroxycyclohexanecarboxyl-CoA dehydrogenase